jgi:hypothetical protein
VIFNLAAIGTWSLGNTSLGRATRKLAISAVGTGRRASNETVTLPTTAVDEDFGTGVK